MRDVEASSCRAVVDKAVRVELELQEGLTEPAVRVGHRPADPEGWADLVHRRRAVRGQHERPRDILRGPWVIREWINLGLVVTSTACRVRDILARMVRDAVRLALCVRRGRMGRWR